jgi:hypothetical protein
MAPSIRVVLQATNTLRVFALGLGLVGCLFSASGCGSEPCEHTVELHLDPGTTPFANGTTVFSVCDGCPVAPAQAGVDIAGPATLCMVGFGDQRTDAGVICFYGLKGGASWPGANDAVKGVPNVFDFCRANCPNEDALHTCSIFADASGVTNFECSYGRTCD